MVENKSGTIRRPRCQSLLVIVACVAAFVAAAPVVGDTVVYFEMAQEWRFFQGTAEPSGRTLDWTQPQFDDSTWSSGLAPFGFGNSPPFGTDLSQLQPPMQDNYTTLYLRTTFEIPELADVFSFVARVFVDDGLRFWINGQLVQVFRAPDGEFVPFDAVATAAHSPRVPEEFVFEDPSSFLVEGTNVVAIQLFNRSITNGDLKFDLELRDPIGPDIVPPSLTSVLPSPGRVVSRLTRIEVSFDEPVTGVDPEDLLINGAAVAALRGSGSGPYEFTFDALPRGEVAVAWRDGHAITDVSEKRNPFAGDPWSYRVDPDVAVPAVVISEFLAANRSGIPDENRDRGSWIELRSDVVDPVRLSGFSLTDDRRRVDKWVFPDVTLDPGARLVVFASGKDRRAPDSELHTNFELDTRGEYLGLYDDQSPRRVIFEVTPRYPQQQPDVSYGLNAAGEFSYLSPPTPLEANDSAVVFGEIVRAPLLSVERGFYTDPVEVTVEAPTAGSEVFFTLDGSEPTPDAETASPYSEPLTFTTTTMLRARAFRSGDLPSATATSTYIFVDDVVQQRFLRADVIDDPASNAAFRASLEGIPILSIVTSRDIMFGPGGAYSSKGDHPASVELIHADGAEGFQVDCSIERHSNAESKTSLRLMFKREYGVDKLRYPFFDSAPLHADSAVREFDRIILRSGKNQSWPNGRFRELVTYVEDQWVRDSQLAMSGIGSHGTFVHLFIRGNYWGLYNPVERPDAWFTSAYFGGGKADYFATNFNIDEGSGRHLSGDPSRFNDMVEMALERELADPERYAAFREFVDVEKFIDYVILFWFSGFGDGIENNWYGGARTSPAGTFMYFMWDGEFIFLSTAGPPGNGVAWVPPYFFNNDLGTTSIVRVWKALLDNPEFRVLFADRVYKHCFNDGALTAAESRARLKALTDFIEDAIVGESARWGGGFTREGHWRPAVERLNQKLVDNVEIFIIALRRWSHAGWPGAELYPSVDPPLFSQHGGEIQPGFLLTLIPPDFEGVEVYVTTDGSDPRTPLTGDVSPGAMLYSEAIALDKQTTVKARALQGGVWSALNEAEFVISDLPPPVGVVISEIFYNAGGVDSEHDVEFVELTNPTAAPLQLDGTFFSDGIRFTFPPGTQLEPGGYIVLASDAFVFRELYPGVALFDTFAGRLADGGERVTLRSAAGERLFSVSYEDSGLWPVAADGLGFSLVLTDGAAVDDPDAADDPFRWHASELAGGSPGRTESTVFSADVFISEVAVQALPAVDAVELVNFEDVDVDVSGWFLSPARFDGDALRRFRIPNGMVIEPGGYLVLRETELLVLPEDPGDLLPHDIGGNLYLSSADANERLTGHITSARFGPESVGTSFGLHATSTGLDFTALRSTTLGRDNAAPRLAEVVINEIHYNPADTGSEFVELFNPGTTALLLDGWELGGVRDRGGEERFAFPDGVTLAARGYALIVGSDPEAFRLAHGVPPTVPIAGPFAGALSNGGERLRLWKPIAAASDVFSRVDSVRYDDAAPWPEAADGDGASLERIEASAYGNEVLNWAASLAAGGTPGEKNSATPDSGSGGQRLPSDITQDGRLSVSDAIVLLGHLFGFLPAQTPCGDGEQAEAGTRRLLDANGDVLVNVADAVYLLNYLFASGPGHRLGAECVPIVGCPNGCP